MLFLKRLARRPIMADMLLIHAPLIINHRGEEWTNTFGDEASNYHMGLLYLAAYSEKLGVTSKILDVSVQKITMEQILDEVEEEKPTLVGISATSAGIKSAVHICREIKKKYKNMPVCLGGAHINCDPDFFDRVPEFDFCIVGEAEKTLYETCIKLKNGEQVKGTLHGEIVENLDELPFPARHLVNEWDYAREEKRHEFGPESLPWATMLGSRGCPFKCTFCSIPAIQHKVRYRSAKSIVDEMEAIYDKCGGKFSFVDDVLTLNRKMTMELCDEILRRGIKARWCGMTRAEILKEDLVIKLAASGCNDLFFGIESGNDRVRNEVIDKRITNAEIADAVKLCKKHGIHTNFLLMVGFPTETLEEIEDTVNIGHKTGADLIGIRQTIPFPGTKVYDFAIQEGMIDKDLIDRFGRGEGWSEKDNFFEKWPKFLPEGVTTEDIVKAKKRAYRKHYLRPTWALSRVRHWFRAPHWFRHDIDLLKVAPMTFLKGKTKGAMS